MLDVPPNFFHFILFFVPEGMGKHIGQTFKIDTFFISQFGTGSLFLRYVNIEELINIKFFFAKPKSNLFV